MDALDNLFGFISKFPSLLSSFGITDAIDIIFVAVVIYQCIKLIRESRAFQLAKGLVMLGILYFLVYEFDMQASTYILRIVFANILMILIVVFQQEIRQIIERIGKNNIGFLTSFFKGYKGGEDTESVKKAIIEICKAVDRMSENKIGALIVMEKDTPLGNIAGNGTALDAKISHELIGNIFYPKSPLHDGAAVIRGDRILAAGCVLPNTQSTDLSSDLGTRHRAAIGLSEDSDAMIIVVSEETGSISVAFGGKLKRDYTEAELRDVLMNYLIETDTDPKAKSLRQIIKKDRNNEEETQVK